MKRLTWLNCALLVLAAGAVRASDLRLVDAVQSNHPELVRALLKEHVDVNAPQPDGATALIWAAHWKNLETAGLLIAAGANVNAANEYGVTPLWEACNNADAPMVGKLANSGANPNATLPGTGETMLMTCARAGSADAVKSLLSHGADVNAKEKQKAQTALMWALEYKHPDVAQLLIEHDADVHAKSKGLFTPLLFAARQGDVASARMLVEHGANVNDPAPGGLTPLLIAADSGQEAFSIFLVEQGANANAADPNGLTALHYALRKGFSILRYVSRFEVGGSASYPVPFTYLLRHNQGELVRVLLEHGANPNAQVTGFRMKYQVVPNGADRPHVVLAGATPFLLATASGDLAIMKALLAHGADSRIPTSDHTTPLMVAAGVGKQDTRTSEESKQALEAVKLLLELGADVNAVNDYGTTALHGAAFAAANDIIQLLVDKGAKLNVEDKFGQTPLSIAEGDPNLYVDDHERSPRGKIGSSTANLIRKLSGKPIVQGAEMASLSAVSPE